MCTVTALVRPVFLHMGCGQGPLDMLQPPSGRTGLMSDSCRRPLPLWFNGAPTFCGPGLFAQRGLRWAPASPCSHDRHRWPSQLAASLPARPDLAFPTGGGGGRGAGGEGCPGDPRTQRITSVPGSWPHLHAHPAMAPGRAVPACAWLPTLGQPGWGQSDQDMRPPH